MNRGTLFGFAVNGACIAPLLTSAAVVTPLSSDRVVSVLNRETIPQTSVSLSGPAFGSWQATAYALNDLGQPNANPNGSPTAVTSTQQSDFSAAGISFTGFVFIDYNGILGSNPGVSATNRCDAVFHVDGNCDYQFQGTYSGTTSIVETSGAVFLRNNATLQNVFSLSASGASSGTLLTGDYTLSILLQGNSGGALFGDSRTQIVAQLSVPAPSIVSMALVGGAMCCSRRRRRR